MAFDEARRLAETGGCADPAQAQARIATRVRGWWQRVEVTTACTPASLTLHLVADDGRGLSAGLDRLDRRFTVRLEAER